ncbi:MAG: RES family NAD+ phosphorylase [Chitinophagaceae bacterium]
MIVYRIGESRYVSDLTGEGASLFGARWNHIGTACLYTSESRALAVLEYTVNVNILDIPRALSLGTFEIPDTGIQVLTQADLPGNWKESPAPSSTKDFGTRLLQAAATPVIKIPSTVIPEEFNYLLNPSHADSRDFRLLDVRDFVYDVRIKKV